VQKIQVIDIHCHAAGIGAGNSGCFIGRRMRRSWKYAYYLKAFAVTSDELEKAGDILVLQRMSDQLANARSVDKAVVFALDGVVDAHSSLDESRTELYVPNEFISRACRQYANLLFGASINPRRRDALDRLDEAVGSGAVLLKWLPSIQGFDPADPSLVPFYRRLAELKLPLLCHTGKEESFSSADNALADPGKLRLALEQGVTVIAAHCASNGRNDGEPNFARFLALMNRYPNLHGDISALTQINRLGHLQRVLRYPEYQDRLHYGTDMPLPRTGLTSAWFQIGRLPLATIRRLSAYSNPWDQDLQLKLALGLPPQVFDNTVRLLGQEAGCGL
jgi:predicted TIM-barrel fold metal-dependent hydrolase